MARSGTSVPTQITGMIAFWWSTEVISIINSMSRKMYSGASRCVLQFIVPPLIQVASSDVGFNLTPHLSIIKHPKLGWNQCDVSIYIYIWRFLITSQKYFHHIFGLMTKCLIGDEFSDFEQFKTLKAVCTHQFVIS